MKKLLTFILASILSIGIGWATDVTFTAGTNTSTSKSLTVDGVTITVSSGTLSRDDNYRVYANSTLTVSSDYTITSIVMTYTTKGYANLSLDESSTGSYNVSETTGTWTGSATSVSFSGTSQSRITKIVVTYGGSSSSDVDAPTFSPEGGTYSSAQTVTLSQADGYTIYYSTDGSNYSVYSSAITVSSTTTIYAYAQDGSGNKSDVVSATYTIKSAGSSTGDFELVTNVSQLAAGDEIIFVSSGSAGSAYAMGGNGSSGNNRSAVDVTVTSDLTVADADDIETFTLEGSTGAWYFLANKINQGYLYAASSSKNYLKTETTADDNAKATISISSNVASIVFQGEYTRNVMQYNSNSTLFACYSSDSQNEVYIYRRASISAPNAPTITPATGSYYTNQSVTITADDGCTIYYTTDGSDPTTSSTVYTGSFTATYTAGGSTTIKAIAVDSDGNESDVTTVVYTWPNPSVSITPGSTSTTASSITVTLSTNPSGGTIKYTTDGGTTWTEVADGTTVTLDLTDGSKTIEAYAVIDGKETAHKSATYTQTTYTIDDPFFSPISGTYYGDQVIKIFCTTENVDIYYTTDGSDPTNSPTRQLYNPSTGFTLTAEGTYTVKAVAYQGTVVSNVVTATYNIKSTDDFSGSSSVTWFESCKAFNDYGTTGVTAGFMNPVQVVWMSTFTNNGTYAEFCYVRDNTDYACIYFGKADTNGYTIFKQGDWLDGGTITGELNIWERNYHNQLGTSSHTIKSWPTSTIGWSKVIPDETTCAAISEGQKDGDNEWGHYVHVRNTTLSGVADESSDDMKHQGAITDLSGGTCTYYDKFYRWSAGTTTYSKNTYTIHCIADYDQDFFSEKQDKGATFDVYGIVDWYSYATYKFEVCPIDFLWIYPPTITPAAGEYTEPQTVELSVDTVGWAPEDAATPTIYYKTDDMEDWAVYTGPFDVSTTTTVYYYSQIDAVKSDGTDYNDYVRSVVQTATYTFPSIADPIIDPASSVYEVGYTLKDATVSTNSECEDGTYTIYTIDGTTPTVTIGTDGTITVGEGTYLIGPKPTEETATLNDITTTTTVTAQSFYIAEDGSVIWSNVVTEIYTFVRSNGTRYELIKNIPDATDNWVFVIVNKEHYQGMSTTQNDRNRAATGVKFVENTNKHWVYGNDELAQFRITQSGNYYYLYDMNGEAVGYLSVNTNDYANLRTNVTTQLATITIGDTVTSGTDTYNIDHSYAATIVFNHEGTQRTMRFYKNQHWFSTYADATLNDDVFLYGIEATPLSTIEKEFEPSTTTQVRVADQLIGTWAVDGTDGDGNTVHLLWVKDQKPYVSIDTTYQTKDQWDYMRHCAWQPSDWDQSNWAILDMTSLEGVTAGDYVNKYLDPASVVGYYTNDLNYTIKLLQAPTTISGEAVGYPGYLGDPLETQSTYYYNNYCPANFLLENLNSPYGSGAVAGENSTRAGDKLFFMNPKVMEIAQVHAALWTGTYFDAAVMEGTTVNIYDLNGAFNVNWKYNNLGNGKYGQPEELTVGGSYTFHIAVARNDYGYGHKRNASAKGCTPSEHFTVYPLDIANGQTPTVVNSVIAVKQVASVRYYNIMGMESVEPFEGVNIVVTRYTDGTSSTVKVLK